MIDHIRIREAVFAAIDELNLQVPEGRKLEKTLDTVLFGSSSDLTSLELVSLILKAEQAVEQVFGTPVTLTSESAMSQTSSPFRTVGTLIEYIARLLDEHSDG